MGLRWENIRRWISGGSEAREGGLFGSRRLLVERLRRESEEGGRYFGG